MLVNYIKQSLSIKSHYPVCLLLKTAATVLTFYALAFLFCGVALTVYAQSDFQTTKYRNIVIDLGNGIKTNARLNLPVTGKGPFPGVPIVPGSGPNDMNGTAGYLRIDKKTG